jgi:hypothetical protein
MGYELHNANRADLFMDIAELAQSSFSIDTATPETVLGWYQKNPSCLVVATRNDSVTGYADFLPLTPKAQELIEERRLKEENITADDILSLSEIKKCRAIYFAGIVTGDRQSIGGARCAAAMIAGAIHVMLHLYKDAPLEFIYANPTTFAGNRMATHLGFGPISYQKKKIDGMDLYMLVLSDVNRKHLQDMYGQYQPLIKSMSWATS